MIIGVLVGGRSSRMGRPKGLLETPGGESILSRTLRISEEAGLELVLVGDASPYREWAPEVPRIADRIRDAGPIAGLDALLAHQDPAILVGCDMPHLQADDLRRLAEHPSTAPVLAARRAMWEPLFARYHNVEPLQRYLEEGRRSLMGLLDRVEVERFEVAPEHLDDWDRPEDLPAGVR